MNINMVQPDSPGLLEAERILLRRRVLDWRDYWSVQAEVGLRAVAAARDGDIATQARQLSHKDLALVRSGRRNLPIVAEIVTATAQAAQTLLSDAADALDVIVAHHLAVEARAAADSADGSFDFRQLSAFARTAAPLAAAAGLGVALPGLATTTGFALFGLVATSTVSVPVLAAGIGGIAALSALGVASFSGLRADQERRLVDAVHMGLEARLFAPREPGREPSLLAGLAAGFAETARELTR